MSYVSPKSENDAIFYQLLCVKGKMLYMGVAMNYT